MNRQRPQQGTRTTAGICRKRDLLMPNLLIFAAAASSMKRTRRHNRINIYVCVHVVYPPHFSAMRGDRATTKNAECVGWFPFSLVFHSNNEANKQQQQQQQWKCNQQQKQQ